MGQLIYKGLVRVIPIKYPLKYDFFEGASNKHKQSMGGLLDVYLLVKGILLKYTLKNDFYNYYKHQNHVALRDAGIGLGRTKVGVEMVKRV